jgi:predicted outer membrane repeat protein
MKKLYTVILLSISIQSVFAQVFVNHQATGANNGNSWLDAYSDLRSAINNTTKGEIWVAQGTYKPTNGLNRSFYFSLKDSVEIYGGFVGSETARSQRNHTTNITILSGDIGILNDSSDNVYHVLRANNVNISSILDGFTIAFGNAYSDNGAGIYNSSSSNKIKNCTFYRNTAIFGEGGAVYNSSSNPSFYNCIFESNQADDGGAVSMSNSNFLPATYTDCTFINNRGLSNGGALVQFYNAPYLKRCSFINNLGYQGGAILLGNTVGSGSGNTWSIDSCLFLGNHGSNGGGCIYSSNGVVAVSNTKFINNTGGTNGGAIFSTGNGVIFDNCDFEFNRCNSEGGAIYLQNGNVGTEIKNCIFNGNRAINGSGGAVSNYYGLPFYVNCIFANDTSGFYGGAIANVASNVTILNCTITGNVTTFPNGGTIYNQSSSNTIIKNCILFGNNLINNINIYDNSATPTVSNCIIEGGYSNGSIIQNVNPLLFNFSSPIGLDNIWRTSDNGLIPTINSLAINNSDINTTAPILDIKNQSRIGIFDIGAYEHINSFPLNLTSFELIGYCNDDKNILIWNNKIEYENYKIEKLQSNEFSQINNYGFILGDTCFIHNSSVSPIERYRISAINKLNGSKIYSNEIQIDNKNTDLVKIFPIPFNQLINLSYFTSFNDKLVIEIIDIKGNIVLRKENSLIKGQNLISLNTSSINAGNYFLIQKQGNGGNKIVRKITKL